MSLVFYIILSILILCLVFILSKRYGLFNDFKTTLLGVLYIILNVLYIGVLNPKAKLHFLYDFFNLGSYPQYSQYINYFTIFMIFSLLLMGLRFIFFGKERK